MQTFIAERSKAAGFVASTMACHCARLGLTEEQASGRIFHELVTPARGLMATEARKTAELTCSLVYASKHDADFQARMSREAAEANERILSWRKMCGRAESLAA
jgi:hypothetical protein